MEPFKYYIYSCLPRFRISTLDTYFPRNGNTPPPSPRSEKMHGGVDCCVIFRLLWSYIPQFVRMWRVPALQANKRSQLHSLR